MNRNKINELRRIYKELMRLESQIERLEMSDDVYRKEIADIDSKFNRYSELEKRKKELEIRLCQITEEITCKKTKKKHSGKRTKHSRFQKFLMAGFLHTPKKHGFSDEKTSKLKWAKHLTEEELKEIERKLFAARERKTNYKKRRTELQGHMEQNENDMARLKSKKPTLQLNLIRCLEECYNMGYSSPEDIIFLERVLRKVASFSESTKPKVMRLKKENVEY